MRRRHAKGSGGQAWRSGTLVIAAWALAASDFEKFTAAHYVARHQPDTKSKLAWDERALDHALKAGAEDLKGAYPSLYLNIAKCHEDLGDLVEARKNYQEALSYCRHLPPGGYGELTRSGILRGLERTAAK